MQEEQELSGRSRSDLLAMCQAAGLKATAWKKERMITELLRAGGSEPVAPEQEPAADSGPAASKRSSEPVVARRLSGWCQKAAMWSRSHQDCGWSLRCDCVCHTEGWVRPDVPENAALSKFNPDNPNRDEL